MDRRLLVGAALFATSLVAQAASVFSDGFEGGPLGLNMVPAGWTVTDGTVDVVNAANGITCKSGLLCVDLDGSTRNAGVLSRSFSLTGGVLYTLSFDLSGNQRGGSDDVTITFGSESMELPGIVSTQPYATFSLPFTPIADALYDISFSNAGGDNLGAILDNVSISAVPEPQTYVLMALGLAAVGVATRRRPTRHTRG